MMRMIIFLMRMIAQQKDIETTSKCDNKTLIVNKHWKLVKPNHCNAMHWNNLKFSDLWTVYCRQVFFLYICLNPCLLNFLSVKEFLCLPRFKFSLWLKENSVPFMSTFMLNFKDKYYNQQKYVRRAHIN